MHEPNATFLAHVIDAELCYLAKPSAGEEAGEWHPIAPIIGVHVPLQVLFPVRLEPREQRGGEDCVELLCRERGARIAALWHVIEQAVAWVRGGVVVPLLHPLEER